MSQQPDGIVCIACSWGGLRALQVVLGALPASFPWPICIVQHRSLQSSTPSLPEMLDKTTALTVVEPDDKHALTPGMVFIAPPGYHMLVQDGHVALSMDDPVRYSRPSADVLFESASIAYGAQVVAVVLTGANDDGARGARVIQDAGGRVIVQEPGDAERAEMPSAAIAATRPVAVLPLQEIAGELVRRIVKDSPS